MSRHMNAGADGKIPYLPPWEDLAKLSCFGFVVGSIITSFRHRQFIAEARSALQLKQSLSPVLANGGKFAVFLPLYFTVEQSLTAARGKSGLLNSFLAGAVAGAVISPTRRPLSLCVSALFMGSGTAIGQLIGDQATGKGKEGQGS